VPSLLQCEVPELSEAAFVILGLHSRYHLHSSFLDFFKALLVHGDHAWTANSRCGLTYCAYSRMNTCLSLYEKARDS
jgi:hypothetical protein